MGMHLRESLLSVVGALRRRVELPAEMERPQDANFVAWSALLMDQLCGGSGNKELRQHLKNIAKETWQLVNWLTHNACSLQRCSVGLLPFGPSQASPERAAALNVLMLKLIRDKIPAAGANLE